MINNLKVFIILLLLTFTFFYGCASIFKGVNEEVNINSEPNGANIYVNGQMLGKTPLQIRLPTKNTHYIEFVKEGYEKKTFILTSSIGAHWIILDILSGLIPIIIDAATGSWYSFDNNYAGVYLEKKITDIDSTDNFNNDTKSSENKYPLNASITLRSDNEEIIFDGKVSLIYKSSGWEKSILSAKGIWGFSKNLPGPFNDNQINLSKWDIFYMRVDSNTFYKIEVIQEVNKNLSLVLTKF